MGTREGKWNFNNSRTKNRIFALREWNQNEMKEVKHLLSCDVVCLSHLLGLLRRHCFEF